MAIFRGFLVAAMAPFKVWETRSVQTCRTNGEGTNGQQEQCKVTHESAEFTQSYVIQVLTRDFRSAVNVGLSYSRGL